MKPLKICLIEPFFGGSHQRWAEELKARSRHDIDLLTLPARHWKWRMHGAAITLAKEVLQHRRNYDLFLATDMLDLNVFLGLVRHAYPTTPAALYFHENQLSYPWSPRDKDPKKRRDLHYAFINYASALAADRVYFNSKYHQRSFIQALPKFLGRYPDFENKCTVEEIAAKSETLPLGLDLKAFDATRPAPATPESLAGKPSPLILWNHRWEYDKNPVGFCKLILELLDRQLDFRVALLGERFEEEPPYFSQLRERLGDRLVAYGRAESFDDYARWLWSADILPVTSLQDFFGGSVVEAVYCGVHPILPKRLAYPDHLDASNDAVFYTSHREALDKTTRLIQSGAWKEPSPLRGMVARYDWSALIGRYDDAFSEVRPHSMRTDSSTGSCS